MSTRGLRMVPWVIFVLVFLGTLAAYPSLPPVMATHFGVNGQVNGTSSALVGAFILPIIMVFLLLLFTAIPYIDPLRVNIQYFRRQYDSFVALLMLFFAVVQSAIISKALGALFDVRVIILPAVGLLIFYVGTLLPKTRRNWFIGIRTPWTISSDHVWQKTHELGGKLFELLGLIIIVSAFVPSYAIQIILIPLVIIVVGLVFYSYFLYAKDSKA